MIDSEQPIKKNIERKKHFRVVVLLKKSFEAITISKRILNLGVKLTVGKLLVFTLVVKKQPTKAIIKDKVIQF